MGWVIWYVHEFFFFFDPLIHADFFSWGLCLQDIFFPPRTFCMNFFCVDRLVKKASSINQIIKDL